MINATVEDIGEATDYEVMDRQVTVDGLRLLDLGCGAGALTRALAERGAQVVGIEPDPIQAEKNRRAEPVPGVSFVEGGAQDLDIDDASVDGVFFKYSLHHVPADAMDAALAEAVRVLKPTKPSTSPSMARGSASILRTCSSSTVGSVSRPSSASPSRVSSGMLLHRKKDNREATATSSRS